MRRAASSRGPRGWNTMSGKRCPRGGIEFKRFGGTLLHDPDRLTTTGRRTFQSLYAVLACAFTAWRDWSRASSSCSVSLAEEVAEIGHACVLGSVADETRLGVRSARRVESGRTGCAGGSGALSRRGSGGLQRHAQPAGAWSGRRGFPRISLSVRSVRGNAGARRSRPVRTKDTAATSGRETFLKELAWREFSAHLLHHVPTLPDEPFRQRVRGVSLAARCGRGSRAWQRGLTGYPIVDAGHAGIVDDGMDAQSRPHDRGVVPDQGSAAALAGG